MLLPDLIPQAFYLRPASEVALDLLGMLLVREGLVLRITEVEAYGGPEDSASHCRAGRTARNAPMWEAGGLELRRGEAPDRILRGPRVGIDYAAPRDRRALLRFAAGGTPWVSRPEGLRPILRGRGGPGIQDSTAEKPLERPPRPR